MIILTWDEAPILMLLLLALLALVIEVTRWVTTRSVQRRARLEQERVVQRVRRWEQKQRSAEIARVVGEYHAALDRLDEAFDRHAAQAVEVTR